MRVFPAPQTSYHLLQVNVVKSVNVRHLRIFEMSELICSKPECVQRLIILRLGVHKISQYNQK
jgi:hypothetical protein